MKGCIFMLKPEYSNLFLASSNYKTGEAVITFYNDWVDFDDVNPDTKKASVKRESVASIVMCHENVLQLLEVVTNLANNYNQDQKESTNKKDD